MPISREQLAAINFGYLNGSDLLQFAPSQVLTSQYDKYPDFFQTGCDMAYEEIKSELIDRYDIGKELSNANQKIVNQTGLVQVNLAAQSYVSKIVLTWNNPLPLPNNGAYVVISSPIIQMSSLLDNSPTVQIGTTLGGNNIMVQDNIQFTKVLWVNKYFSAATVLYFSIDGGNVDIDITCNSGKLDPVITPVEYYDKSTSFTVTIPADTYIYQIFGKILLDTPVIEIGTTASGDEIVQETTIANTVLPIETDMNYFENETVIYITLSGGSTDLRFDLGLNYTEVPTIADKIKNPLLKKIISIFALRNILGSVSGDNKIMQAHFDWADNMILKIKERQISLTIDAAPVAVASKAYTIKSSYRTIG